MARLTKEDIYGIPVLPAQPDPRFDDREIPRLSAEEKNAVMRRIAKDLRPFQQLAKQLKGRHSRIPKRLWDAWYELTGLRSIPKELCK